MYPTLGEKQKNQPKGDFEKIFITPFEENYIVGFNLETIGLEKVHLQPYLAFICENWSQGKSEALKENFNQEFLLHLT